MAFRRRARTPVDVNLTPLIDVVFLLLIFFMVTTTFKREARLLIDLPEADYVETEVQADVLEVIIDAQGQYAVNGLRLSESNRTSLVDALRSTASDKRDQNFLISADAKSPHQAVVTVMEVAGEMAFTKIAIATQNNDQSNN